jgi:phosphonatase-like hydrolase
MTSQGSTQTSIGLHIAPPLRDTLADNGLDIPADAVHEVKGMDKREALRILIESSAMRDELLPGLDAIHEDFVERLIEFYRSDPSVTEVPGASETFRRLHQAGVKVALNTGFNRQIVEALLERLGWANNALIDATVASDEVERGRPHPDMIQYLMFKLGVTDPQRTAKVGDTPADLLEGRNAGCGLVFGVTGGSRTREQLEKFPHDHLINSVSQLPEFVGA